MRETLAEICIWILRKLKVSCIIGMKVNSKSIYGKNELVYWHDSDFNDVEPQDIYGNKLPMTFGKAFRIETKEKGI